VARAYRDPLPAALIERVEEIVRDVASREIMPSFRRLAQHEISAKTPGEVVTTVDVKVEAQLTRQLQALLPGSRVVGEEAASADLSLLRTLSDGDVWLVDPLDGTGNFAAGLGPFACMIALLRAGETVCSWMFDPLGSHMAFAEQGAGAFVDGERVRATALSPGTARLRGAVLTRFLPKALAQSVLQRSQHVAEILTGTGCAGAEYPGVVRGAPHFALYWRTLPWDHAPGALFLSEAGGCVGRVDGSAYRAWDGQSGLLAASNPAIWHDAHRALLA
jgi:fructose-1,6-bisphosphatase/inositol monophosphatase family enzyme